MDSQSADQQVQKITSEVVVQSIAIVVNVFRTGSW